MSGVERDPREDAAVGSAPATPTVVRAFGGVVWERSDDGTLRLAVVHRPRYDDWSFPKGKVDPGERPEQTARREVNEETGLECSLNIPLGELIYQIDDGTTKIVGYWAMTPLARRERPPDHEIDAVEWWTSDEAAARLTHAQDRELLARFLARVPEASGATAALPSREQQPSARAERPTPTP